MPEVIIIPKHRIMLAPMQKCFGAKFGTLKRKFVSYKLQDYVMLDWTVESCRVLAAIGFQIKSPMSLDYAFKSKYIKPFDHQIVTADFMVQNLRSFCFNDIGTSKTLTALWAADFLMDRKEIDKVLICATLSTLNRVWELEIFQNLMHRNCVVIHGSMTVKKRTKLFAEAHDFYIMNHECVKGMVTQITARKDISLVICDEGARFRNQKTNLWKSMYAIAGVDSKRGVWWLTGSPMPRAPTDAWAQARIVNPGTVPRYFSRFRDQTMYQLNQFKWVPRRGWEDTVYSSLKPSIRFNRDECLDLPKCMYIDHNIAMSPEQVKAYNSLKEHFIVELNDGLITASNEGVKLMKLLQVACGAIYDNEGVAQTINCAHKLKELESISDEVGTKLIVFCPFKHSIKVITRWLKESKNTLTYGIVNGDVGKAKRDKIFDDFQNGDLDWIIAHPAAMAHGLTLTAANTICWFGPIDNFEYYEQANGRITRPGQERKQYIKHLICSPVEKAVYARLKKKESMQGILLDMIKK